MPVSFFIENPPNTWSIIRVYCTGTLMYRYSYVQVLLCTGIQFSLLLGIINEM